ITMLGQLFQESSRLNHVQTVFVGRVIEVGQTKDGDAWRPVRPGDQVVKGQTLAKLWSKEVGEKKSNLVNVLSKLYYDEYVLRRYRTLQSGVVPLAKLHDAEREYAADVIEINTLQRTLRSWQIKEEELQS